MIPKETSVEVEYYSNGWKPRLRWLRPVIKNEEWEDVRHFILLRTAITDGKCLRHFHLY